MGSTSHETEGITTLYEDTDIKHTSSTCTILNTGTSFSLPTAQRMKCSVVQFSSSTVTSLCNISVSPAEGLCSNESYSIQKQVNQMDSV